MNVVFHLHGFKHADRVSGVDHVANFHGVAHDGAGQWGFDHVSA